MAVQGEESYKKHRTDREQKEYDHASQGRREEINREVRHRVQAECKESGCNNDAVNFPKTDTSRGTCTQHTQSGEEMSD